MTRLSLCGVAGSSPSLQQCVKGSSVAAAVSISQLRLGFDPSARNFHMPEVRGGGGNQQWRLEEMDESFGDYV